MVFENMVDTADLRHHIFKQIVKRPHQMFVKFFFNFLMIWWNEIILVDIKTRATFAEILVCIVIQHDTKEKGQWTAGKLWKPFRKMTDRCVPLIEKKFQDFFKIFSFYAWCSQGRMNEKKFFGRWTLGQGPATHGITGATSGGSRAAKYNFISFFLYFYDYKNILFDT